MAGLLIGWCVLCGAIAVNGGSIAIFPLLANIFAVCTPIIISPRRPMTVGLPLLVVMNGIGLFLPLLMALEVGIVILIGALPLAAFFVYVGRLAFLAVAEIAPDAPDEASSRRLVRTLRGMAAIILIANCAAVVVPCWYYGTRTVQAELALQQQASVFLRDEVFNRPVTLTWDVPSLWSCSLDSGHIETHAYVRSVDRGKTVRDSYSSFIVVDASQKPPLRHITGDDWSVGVGFGKALLTPKSTGYTPLELASRGIIRPRFAGALQAGKQYGKVEDPYLLGIYRGLSFCYRGFPTFAEVFIGKHTIAE